MNERNERVDREQNRLEEVEHQLVELLTRITALGAEVRAALTEVRNVIGLPPTPAPSSSLTEASPYQTHLRTELLRRPSGRRPQVSLKDTTLSEVEALLRKGLVPRHFVKRANGLTLALLLEQSPRQESDLAKILGFKNNTIITTMTSVRDALFLCDAEIVRDDTTWNLQIEEPKPWMPKDVTLHEPLEQLAGDLLKAHRFSVEEPVLSTLSTTMRRVLAHIVGMQRDGKILTTYDALEEAIPHHDPRKMAFRLHLILGPAGFRVIFDRDTWEVTIQKLEKTQ
jgi:hypothetical protein